MKIPQLNSQPIKKFLNPAIILVLLFFILVGIEAYILYYKVYGNLSTKIEDQPISVNVVHLDVNNYNKMIELIDSLKIFEPKNEVYENPFK